MHNLNRRSFGLCLLSTALYSGPSSAQETKKSEKLAVYDRQLAEATADEMVMGDARAYRELDYREDGPSPEALAAAPNIPRRYKSDKSISARAKALIIRFEVTGQKKYNASYKKPVWPKKESGVTIGIGYDIGYCAASRLTDDWNGIIVDTTISNLSSACGVKGRQAAALLPFLQDVEISWAAAVQQFDRFIPFVAGQVVQAFPRSVELSADSFGALVSLVYNRGSGMKSQSNDSIDRRKEMRAVRDLIASGDYVGVPTQIRAMTRIWQDDHDARGLLERRALEASLFEAGL